MLENPNTLLPEIFLISGCLLVIEKLIVLAVLAVFWFSLRLWGEFVLVDFTLLSMAMTELVAFVAFFY